LRLELFSAIILFSELERPATRSGTQTTTAGIFVLLLSILLLLSQKVLILRKVVFQYMCPNCFSVKLH